MNKNRVLIELSESPRSSIWSLESEVNNGGFLQYFPDICQRAIACAFPNGLPATFDAISAAAQTLPDEVLEQLDRLDGEFMSYPDDLTQLLYDYVSRHPDEFGRLPSG